MIIVWVSDGPSYDYNPRKTGLYRDWNSGDTIRLSVILVIFAIIAIAVYKYLSTPDRYIVQVKCIQWRYVINIQTYRVVHESGWERPPKDAYNIDQVYKERYEDDYQWYYTYDVNRWVPSRNVVSQGYDKNPYWKEYELYVSKRNDNIGSERESGRSTIYTISGTIRGAKNDNLVSVEVSEDIWSRCKLTDELVYMKSKIGKPYDIHIAE